MVVGVPRGCKQRRGGREGGQSKARQPRQRQATLRVVHAAVVWMAGPTVHSLKLYSHTRTCRESTSSTGLTHATPVPSRPLPVTSDGSSVCEQCVCFGLRVCCWSQFCPSLHHVQSTSFDTRDSFQLFNAILAGYITSQRQGGRREKREEVRKREALAHA